MFRSKDKSQNMAKGGIKKILIEVASEETPDFAFREYKNGVYTFQRKRAFRTYEVFELFHIGFSLKSSAATASIASRLNPRYVHSSSYNNGLLNPHCDLISLKKASKLISYNEATYNLHTNVETGEHFVRTIFKDFKIYGTNLLESQFNRLNSNAIISHGLDYLDNLELNKQELNSALELELKNIRYVIHSIKHPAYLELREYLQALSGQTREDRRLIPRLTLELLEVYCNT